MAGFVFRRNTAAAAALSNPILREGEGGFETDTGVFKIGDGVTHYNDLPYYVDTDKIQELVDAAVSSAPGGIEALYAHINSLAPHPAYDDGPTFTLLYENAKV